MSQRRYKWQKPLAQAEQKLEARKETELLHKSAFKMMNVTSTNVKQIGYDEQFKRLRVVFKSGEAYQYFNVDPATFAQVKSGSHAAMYPHPHSPSIGSALDAFVKKAGIRYQKE